MKKSMEELLCMLLWAQLQFLDWRTKAGLTLADLKQSGHIVEKYHRWFTESIHVLARYHYIQYDQETHVIAQPVTLSVDEVWQEWHRVKAEWQSDQELRSQIALVESTLQALPSILTGEIPATDVLFPDSSLHLVKGIYKQNAVADYFNEVLADTVGTCVQGRLQQASASPIRILEIGAGTGGTSAKVFQKLIPYQDAIVEYCYTDISKAFLQHAERNYGPWYPYLNYRTFNVEEPIIGQGFTVGTYNIVIAANVLHATKNIRRTLRNVKAMLQKHGILLLNEMSRNTLFLHLTFGLLEGWWLYEDPELRLAGCPGLSSTSWQNVLEGEGFYGTFFPVHDAHYLGQQVIVTQSDGIVRQVQSQLPAGTSQRQQTPPPVKNEQSSPKQTSECVLAADISQEELRARSTDYFKHLVGDTLKVPIERIDPAEPLEMYGLDSILTVRLNKMLSAHFKDISRTIFFEYQTIDELVDHFLQKHRAALMALIDSSNQLPDSVMTVDEAPRTVVSPLSTEGMQSDPSGDESVQPKGKTQKIAIIGISGRFAQAETLQEFWDNLKQQRKSITEIPPERWDWRDYYHEQREEAIAHGKSYSKWGGFLNDFHQFDPLFFNMTPQEAEDIDPQERLFLEECWKAMEDAGHAPSRMPLRLQQRTAVFGGITKLGFNLYSREAVGHFPVTSFASLVNRVSYYLNLQGPSIPIDTMCSSALVAIHEACEYIRQGKGEMAIAGGVNLYVHPVTYTALSRGQLLAATSESAAFGAGGVGFVPAEGVGAIVLKDYEQALADHDNIYAVIIGSAVNHKGKTNGYLTPNPLQQAEVIQQALAQNETDPRTISYIEAFAYGSEIVDALEMNALQRVFQTREDVEGQYRIGSVKPNIGHCEAASGMSQLFKVLLSMQHKTLVPTLMGGDLNPTINFAQLPFHIQREVSPWELVKVDGQPVPRRAGISSFGGGGVNAHIIVEEYHVPVAVDVAQASAAPFLFPLSAKSQERLYVYVQNVVTYLEEHPQIDLENTAYTLQIGRDEMSSRLAVIAHSREELIAHWKQWLEDHTTSPQESVQDPPYHPSTPTSVYSSDLKKVRQVVQQDEVIQACASRNIHKLARLWTLGNVLPWEKIPSLHGSQYHKIGGLPTYPFKRRNCWPVGIVPCTNRVPTLPGEKDMGASHPRGERNNVVEIYTFSAHTSVKDFQEEYLTLYPFEKKVPGFSMSRVLLHPEQYQEEREYVRAKQIEMRQVLFCRENFHAMQAILDFGCGYGTDVIQIALLYPHIHTHGFTITPAQAELGKQRIAQFHLESRAQIWQKDSSRDPFPGRYDCIFGIEVSFHIRRKQELFRNIAHALNEDGSLLLVDYIANTQGAIVDPLVEVSIPTAQEWTVLLAQNHLRIDEIIDVSTQIANSSADPEIEQNVKDLPEPVKALFYNIANQALSLEKGWISYCLIKIKKDTTRNYSQCYQINAAKIVNKTPYSEALAETLQRGHIPYPPMRREEEPIKQPSRRTRNLQPVADIKERLAEVFTTTLGIERTDLEEADSLKELGIGSLNAVQLTEAINVAFHLKLPTSIIFECNTFNALVNAIVGVVPCADPGSLMETSCVEVVSRVDPASPIGTSYLNGIDPCDREGISPTSTLRYFDAPSPSLSRGVEDGFTPSPERGQPYPPLRSPAPPRTTDIAIIGISCRCAGANGQEEFWELISQGKSCIKELMDQNWLEFFASQEAPAIATRYGAMEQIDCFDPAFFKISPCEAQAMDITQRILLEESYRALEDAGYLPSSLQGQPVGTFIGAMAGTTVRNDLSHLAMLGSDTSIAAARIAYFLDLKGPALAINTACSSSLVAIDIACQKLKSDEISLAIAGGITIYTHPSPFVAMSNAGMLSPTGECRPFDNDANGIVVGDGVGIVILKRLQDALRDRDSIYGVIRGSGINQDGSTLGITAPSFQAQSQLQTAIYQKNQIDVANIQYIEAHGTATKLGDPVEIHALSHTFPQFTSKKRFCAIGSLKANIGHTTTASGVLSVIKVLLSMKHKLLPPSINFARENEHIDFANSPVYVNTSLKEWGENAHGSRLAAVNSFGFSGTNAHLVIEEFREQDAVSEGTVSHAEAGLLLLSAQTKAGLLCYAENLRAFLLAHKGISMPDFLYTFQVARESMPYRLALVVEDQAGAIAQLDHFIAGRGVGICLSDVSRDAGVIISDTEEGREFIYRLAARGQIRKLAELWINKNQIDWSALYPARTVRRLSGLPSYPFARERYPLPPVSAQRDKVQTTETEQWTASDPETQTDMGIGDRKGRDGVNPSSTHLPGQCVDDGLAPIGRGGKPNPPLRSLVAAIWSEVLGIEHIDIHSNFHDLGGDSVMAAQILSRLKKRFPFELQLQNVFEFPTIAGMAQALEEELISIPADCSSRPSANKPALLEQSSLVNKHSEIPQRRHVGPVPLSFAQQRLWFLDQLVSNSPAYNVVMESYLTGQLELRILEQCLNEIIRRHEALRTTFQSIDGQPYQVIASQQRITLSIVDVTPYADPERQEQLQLRIQEESRHIFDLTRGPLFRATVYLLREEKYVFLLNVHHIVMDGWSVGVFLKELFRLYRAFSIGSPSPMPEMPIQYADFSTWQRDWLQGEVVEEQLTYWRAKLAKEAQVLSLPLDRTRPPVQRFNGGSLKFRLPSMILRAIKVLCQHENATLFVILMTALNILLHRYTGQNTIRVGTPVANRNKVELEDLIGFFVNTLVLQTDLSGNPSFLELLARVREEANSAYKHQDLPFEVLVDDLQPERYMSQNPLFEVCFVLQNFPLPKKADMAGLSFTLEKVEEVHNNTAKFDLWIQALERDDSLDIDVEYNSDIFLSSTVARMLESFENLLFSIIKAPDSSIAELPILSPHQEQTLLFEWNNTFTNYPQQERCLHEIIMAQARQTPTATAIIFSGQQLTYEELDQQSNQLAHYLIQAGVGPDTLVGIAMERSVEMVVGLLGILKAGGAYVPIDPAYPRDRIAYMIEDANPPILLTQQKYSHQFIGHQGKIMDLDTDWNTIATQNANPPSPRRDTPNHRKGSSLQPLSARNDKLAYMIYTSGSTGKPKGTMNTHRGIVNRLLWMQERFQLDATDRVLQKTPFSFDVSVWEFFWPLMVGACLVVAEPEGHKDTTYLARLIQQEKITTLHFVPSMLQVFLEDDTIDRCSTLKRVICSGEALPYATQERFFAKLQAELHNLYGPTEAAVDVTHWICQRQSEQKIVPIGRPIANTQIYILDNYMHPVPVGVPGELHIGGVQLARGYHNRPELTSEKFIPNPFVGTEPCACPSSPSVGTGLAPVRSLPTCSCSGERLYKTGDLARHLPDGTIEFLGRIDSMVKLRGVRIELGEIERVLEEHPAVQTAALVVHTPDQTSEHKQLMAYIVPNRGYMESLEHVDTEGIGTEQVVGWQNVFDKAYDDGKQYAAGFNIASWNSSYTGLPLSDAEMRDWVNYTVERIQPLHPCNVLEIGCGTGLLLSRIASHCDQYWGTDFSPVALNYLSHTLLKERSDLSHVQLFRKNADDFSGFARQQFDLVIINSVVQYFPDAQYLLRVLEQAINLVSDGGAVFVGDVRCLPLLETFLTEVEVERATSSQTIHQLQGRIQKRLQQEQELVIDPAFFFALQEILPRISYVELQVKRGSYHNELTRYRYDVVLHINKKVERIEGVSWFDWKKDNFDAKKLKNLLTKDKPEMLGINNIPNLRLEKACQYQRLLKELDQSTTVAMLKQALAESKPDTVINPEELFLLADALQYSIEISWVDHDQNGRLAMLLKRNHFLRHEDGNTLFAAWSRQQKHWIGLDRYVNASLLRRSSQQLLSELRKHLREKLPENMVPTMFEFLREMPMNAHGKLDYKALPAPLLDTFETDKTFVEPVTEAEKVLTEVWAEVLHLEKVSITQNFFESGGDSIHSIQIVARARKRGIELTTQQIFLHQTISELAASLSVGNETALQQRPTPELPLPRGGNDGLIPSPDRGQPYPSGLVPIPTDLDDVYPLTAMQENMLYQHLHAPRSGLNIVHHVFHIKGEQLRVDAFEKAWQEVISQFSALRTSFAWEGLDEPQQVVHKDVSIHLDRKDWRSLEPSVQKERLKSLIQSVRTQGFDLTTAPHTYIALLQVEDDAYYFIYVFNLMLQDGWSYTLIIKTLFAYYQAFVAGRLPEKETFYAYRDYIRWQRKQDLAEAETFWKHYLLGVSAVAPTLVASQMPSKKLSYRQERAIATEETTAAILSLARQQHLTPYALVQGAWALMLSKYSGKDDVVFGTVFSGRSAASLEVEQSVGLFFNILPLRVQIDPHADFLTWIQHLQTKLVETSRYEYTPLREIYRWCGIPRERLLFDSYLVSEQLPDFPAVFQGFSAVLGAHIFDSLAQTEHPLRVELLFINQVLVIHINCYQKLFGAKKVRGMLKDLLNLLKSIAAKPEQKLSDLLHCHG